ncbi:MAG: hypothetical protein FWG69_04145 [Oscillospiraceae bacterium]|nr:hypothetical protein [Oscillospiraceae bacterium]
MDAIIIPIARQHGQTARIWFLSMTVTLLVMALIYFSYVAVENTRIAAIGASASYISAVSDNNKLTVTIFGKEYTISLESINRGIEILEKYKFLIPRPLIAVFQLFGTTCFFQ